MKPKTKPTSEEIRKEILEGIKIAGKTLWKGISRASRNLDRNAPEFKEFSKTMTAQPSTDLEKLFFPRQKLKQLGSWGLP